MSDFILNADPRTIRGRKVNRLRNEGLVPGVVYGSSVEPKSVQFTNRELEAILRHAGLTNLINLKIADEKEKRTVLVRDIQHDMLKGQVLHVDLMQVAMDELLTTEIGIVLVGETEIEGFVVQDTNSIQIQCLPGDLIPVIEVDISGLINPGDTLTLADLNIKDTITILAEDTELVAHVEAHGKEEIEPEEELPEILDEEMDEELDA